MTERELISRVRKRYWRRAIEQTGSVAGAAKMAGYNRQNAYRIVRRLGLGEYIQPVHRGNWQDN